MTKAAIAAFLVLLAACADPKPPVPPPFHGAPPGPPAELGEKAAPIEPVVVAPVAPLAPAVAPLVPHLSLEPAFRLDKRVVPPSRALFLADLADRTRWNHGGLGELSAPLPPVPGHPAPKVIVDVTGVHGAHKAADLQRVLRKMFWIKVVGCYGLGAYKDQTMRGTAAFGFSVSSAGKVSNPKVGKTTLADPAIAACLAQKIRGIELPKASGRSTVAVEVQIGPGSEPMPPPFDQLTPGEGELSPAVMGAVVEAALPAFEGCYREALAYAPELWGRLGLRFHVTEKGKTDEAFEAESQFPDERLTICILHQARRLKFPKPAGGDLRFVVPLRLWSDRSAHLK